MFEKFFFLKEIRPMKNKTPPSGGWGCIPSYNNPPLPPEKVNKMKSRKEILQDYLAKLIKEKSFINDDLDYLILNNSNWWSLHCKIKTIKEMQEVIDYLVKEIENEN